MVCCKKEIDTSSPPVMILPVANVDDFLYIGRIFSSTSNSPLGAIHRGLDFVPDSDMRAFQSVFDGKVTRIDLFENEDMGNWQVNVHIEYNDAYSTEYAFEPFSTNQSDGQLQLNYIQVHEGQHVDAGQIIGLLYTPFSNAHVHFSFFHYNEMICPENYWTEEAREAIMDLIHAYNPDWEMCY
jgi:murein DD-endopeptidase MepM/ murein hydrolase activator NlpD